MTAAGVPNPRTTRQGDQAINPLGGRPVKVPYASWFLRSSVLLPLLVASAFLLTWDGIVRLSGSELFPKPLDVWWGLGELVKKGLLLKYVVASLFRVTWGFTLAVLVGVPFGLLLGWSRYAQEAFNPLIQAFRPISPIAWIPLAILWFGISDAAPIFLIFLASVFPILVSSAAAVKSVPTVYLRVAQNFGLTRSQLVWRVILPATLPQILTGLRITLGVAWLVVVAAEMIAVNSGLGYLIIDARNAGKRYDLVVAGMVVIGLIGWLLDLLMRLAERFQALKWAYGIRHE
ncbi:MAG: ABC-type nitrate/sulfonate/bicarbonate transport system, permease component [Planctomycetaceae bacterium]|nr:ABC-type nitrate/sulfonate/bicarbonate transport system, permease component [Planctomycetaceae bacterium]